MDAPRLGPVVQYALMAGPLLSMVDSSIVNVAVEPMARGLHTSLPTVQWAVSGYLLAMGAGLAAVSFLARRLGTLRVYRAGLLAFTLASAACALAPTIGLLLAARVVQGLTGAPLVPLTMSMALGAGGAGAAKAGGNARQFSPVAGMLLFLGPALGPSLGGALIGSPVGWRTIFLVNVPLGALAWRAARRIPASLAPGRDADARFDLAGLAGLAGGLTLLLFGFVRAGTDGWSAPSAVVPMVGGALLLAGYAVWSVRRDQPALDLSLLRHRAAAWSLLLCGAASVVTYAAVFLLPVFAQSVQGHGALATGLAMLPQGLVTGLSTLLGRRVLTRVSVRTTVVAGFAVLAAASAALLVIGAHTSLWVTAAVLTVRSASIGLVITPLLAAMLTPLRDRELADANAVFSIWQRIAGSFGIGLIATLYTTQAVRHGPVASLHTTGLVIAGLAAVAAVCAFALPATRNARLA